MIYRMANTCANFDQFMHHQGHQKQEAKRAGFNPAPCTTADIFCALCVLCGHSSFWLRLRRAVSFVVPTNLAFLRQAKSFPTSL